MSAFKRINVSDSFVVPYTANKSWSIPSSSFNSYNIAFNIGTKYADSFFDSNNESQYNGQYDRLIYDLIGINYYPEFYPKTVSTASMQGTIYNDGTLATSSYYWGRVNLGNLDTEKYFPTGANEQIFTLSFSRQITGDKILPTTFEISFDDNTTFSKIYDDGNYNLRYSGSSVTASNGYTILSQSSYVGNIFYEQNIAVITYVPNNFIYNTVSISGSNTNVVLNNTNVSFKNNHVIYENFTKCTIKDYEYNLSYNPTLLSGNQGILVPYSSSNGGNTVYTTSPDNYGILKEFTIGNSTYYYRQSVSYDQSMFAGGTNVLPPYVDDGTVNGISIGFDFSFYGTIYNTCNLSSNGNLQFVTSDDEFQDGYPLPYTPFGPAILALWSDLVIDSGYRADAGVYTQTIGSPGSRIFVATWNVDFYDNPNDTNFQIRLYEGTNVIELVYGSMTNPDENYVTIGIQDGGIKVMDYYQDSINHLYPMKGTMIKYTPYQDFDFSPYVSTIGLYNDAQELLAVAKMASPMPISANTDMTFLVKWDTNFTSPLSYSCKNYSIYKYAPTILPTSVSYTDCSGNKQVVSIADYETITFCAVENSLDTYTNGGGSLTVTENGSCS